MKPVKGFVVVPFYGSTQMCAHAWLVTVFPFARSNNKKLFIVLVEIR